MSRSIDQRIVEMRFENSQFEQATAQSMSTLDKLKEKLKFKDAADGLGEIDKAAKKLDFTQAGESVDYLGRKFSALERIAIGALEKIGRDIEDYLVKTLKSVTIEPLEVGWNKFADKTKAVQTIMASTRQEIGSTFASESDQMDYVNEQMDKLNWFTDETSYNFVDMVSNIGKFTSAGVKLDDAVQNMMGIANWAAISGANVQTASRAMYNMSQAIGAGYMLAIDWRSIENANMATLEFKQLLIDVAERQGKIQRVSEDTWLTAKGNELKATALRQTLADKWLDSEVMVEALNVYGAFTEELYKVSEATGLTATELLQAIDKYKEGSLDLAQVSKETGTSVEELNNMFATLGSDTFELGRAAFKAAQEAKTFKEVIEYTQDAVSSGWMKTFQMIFGDYDEAKKLWSQMAEEFYDIFVSGGDERNDALRIWKEELGGREKLLAAFKNIYDQLKSIFMAFREGLKGLFPEDYDGRIKAMAERFMDVTEAISRFSEKVKFSETTVERFRKAGALIADVISAIGKAINDVVYIFTPFAKIVKDTFTFLADKIFGGLDKYTPGSITKLLDTDGWLNAIVTLREIVEAFANIWRSLFSPDSWADLIKEGGGGLAGIGHAVKQTFLGIAGIIAGLFTGDLNTVATRMVDGNAPLSKLPDFLKNFLLGIGEAVDQYNAGRSDLGMSFILDAFTGLESAMNLANKIPESATGRLGALRSFLVYLQDVFGIAGTLYDAYMFNGGEGVDANTIIYTVMRKYISAVNGIYSLIEMITGIDMSEAADKFTNSMWQITNVLLGFEPPPEGWETRVEALRNGLDILLSMFNPDWIKSRYQMGGGGIGGVLNVIKSELKGIVDFVLELVQLITGADLTNAKQNIDAFLTGLSNGITQIVNGDVKEGLKTLGTTFSDAFKDMWDALKDKGTSINNKLHEMAEEGNTFAKFYVDKVIPAFEKVKAFFADFKISSITDALAPIMQNTGKSAAGAMSNLGLPDMSQKLPTVWDTFLAIIEKIKDKLDEFLTSAKYSAQNIYNSVTEKVKAFIKGIVDALSSEQLAKIFDNAKRGTLAWLIFELARLFHNIANGTTGFGKVTKKITEVFSGLKGLIKAEARHLNADSFQKVANSTVKIAAAMGIFAAAVIGIIWALDRINNPEAVAQGTILIMGILGLITAIMAISLRMKELEIKKDVAASVKDTSENVKSIAVNIVDAAKGAIDNFSRGLTNALEIWAKNANKWITILAFIGFIAVIAASLTAMYFALKKDPSGVLTALLWVGIILAGLVIVVKGINAATKGMSRRAASTILAFTIFLGVFVSALKTINKMGPDKAVEALGVVALIMMGMLLIVGIMARVASTKSFNQLAANMAKFAWGLLSMVVPLMIFAAMDPDAILIALIKITGIVITLAAISWAMSQFQTTALAIPGSGGGSIADLASQLIKLGGALIIFSVGALAMSMVPTGTLIAIAVGIAAIAGVAALVGNFPTLAAGLATLSMSMLLFGFGVAAFGAGVLMTVAAFLLLVKVGELAGQGVDTIRQKVLIGLWLIITTVVEVMIKSVPIILDALIKVIEAFADGIVQYAEPIFNALKKLFKAIWYLWVELLQELFEGINYRGIMDPIIGDFEKMKDGIKKSMGYNEGESISAGFMEGFGSGLSSGSANIDSSFNNISSLFSGFSSKFDPQSASSMASGWVGGMTNGFASGIPGLESITSQMSNMSIGNFQMNDMMYGLTGEYDINSFISAFGGGSELLNTTSFNMANIPLDNLFGVQDQYAEAGAQAAEDYVQPINFATQNAANAARTMADAGVEGARAELGQYETAGDESSSHYSRALKTTERLKEAHDAGDDVSAEAIEGLKSVEEARVAGLTTAATYATTIRSSENLANSENAGEWLGNQAALGANSRVSDFETAGNNTSTGFFNSLRRRMQEAWNTGSAFAGSIWSGICNRLGINSPSTETYQLGIYTVDGFVNALADRASYAFGAGSDLAQNAYDGLNQAMIDANNMLNQVDSQPTIRPVVDLSNVQSSLGYMNSLGGNYGVNLSAANVSGLNTGVHTGVISGDLSGNSTTNNNNSNTFTININGGPNSNPREIADEVINRINTQLVRGKAVYA